MSEEEEIQEEAQDNDAEEDRADGVGGRVNEHVRADPDGIGIGGAARWRGRGDGDGIGCAVAVVWRWCGGSVEMVWRRLGDGVVTAWRQRGDGVSCDGVWRQRLETATALASVRRPRLDCTIKGWGG